MKTKFLLPVLAIIFAIGMSFAFVNATGENYYASGFVEIDGDPYPVGVNCDEPNSEEACLVNIQGLPNNPYTVMLQELRFWMVQE